MDKDITFSIICMNNNDDILNEWLLKSINEQTYKKYEIIIISTIKNGKSKFKSARDALSSIDYDACKGKYLLFCHNDIRFCNKSFLSNLAKKLDSIDFNIVGFAGMIQNSRREYVQYSSVLYGETDEELKYTGDYEFGTFIDVQTLDECCYVVPKNKYMGFKNIGNTWDLYAVQYCLEIIKMTKNINNKIYVVDESIRHKSNGNVTKRYALGLVGLKKYYAKTTPIIFTTIGIFDISLSKKDIYWNLGFDPRRHLLSRVFHFFFPNRHPLH